MAAWLAADLALAADGLDVGLAPVAATGLSVADPRVIIANIIRIALGFKERDAEGSHVFFNHPDGRTTVISIEEYDKLGLSPKGDLGKKPTTANQTMAIYR